MLCNICRFLLGRLALDVIGRDASGGPIMGRLSGRRLGEPSLDDPTVTWGFVSPWVVCYPYESQGIAQSLATRRA